MLFLLGCQAFVFVRNNCFFLVKQSKALNGTKTVFEIRVSFKSTRLYYLLSFDFISATCVFHPGTVASVCFSSGDYYLMLGGFIYCHLHKSYIIIYRGFVKNHVKALMLWKRKCGGGNQMRRRWCGKARPNVKWIHFRSTFSNIINHLENYGDENNNYIKTCFLSWYAGSYLFVWQFKTYIHEFFASAQFWNIWFAFSNV